MHGDGDRAARGAGSIGRPISLRVSSIRARLHADACGCCPCVACLHGDPPLNWFAGLLMHRSCRAGDAQRRPSHLLMSSARRPPTRACDAVAGGHRDDQSDLVGRRRTGHAHLDGVEMAAHVAALMLVSGTSSARRAGRPSWSTARSTARCRAGRSSPRPCLAVGVAVALPAEQLAHRVAAGHMPQRAVLELAGGADDARPCRRPGDPRPARPSRRRRRARHVDADRIEQRPSSAGCRARSGRRRDWSAPRRSRRAPAAWRRAGRTRGGCARPG